MPTDVLGARTLVHASAEALSVGTADALVPLIVQRGGAAASAASGTALVVSTGRTLRLMSAEFSVVILGTTVTWTRIRLRATLGSGTVALTSPMFHTQRLGGNTAVVNHVYVAGWKWPEGLEFPAGSNIGVAAQASTGAMHSLDASLLGFEYTP